MAASVEEAQVKQFEKLKQQIQELQMRYESLELELWRREWSHSACLRERDALIRKYKHHPLLAAEQQRVLEPSNMQAELDRQQLCEDAESNRDQGSEDVQSLSPGGEKIFQYDDKSSLRKDGCSLEIRKLQEQNANLRAAVALMRREIETLDEQMLSPLPVTEGRQLAEQGSLCTSKVSAGTTVSSISVTSANWDCTGNPDTEKGPKLKLPEEKMVDRGQQFPDVGPGVGLQYGVSCPLQGMRNELKEAARKISVLSREKQQLIEMGNRLRADLGAVLKEGLWHPVSSKCCTVCTASGSLFPRELVKRTQCQLSALQHLQQRLTAQVQLDFSTENHGPERRKAESSLKIVGSQPPRPSPSQAQQVHHSSPRACHFSQGVWQTWDVGPSPSVLGARESADRGFAAGDVLRQIKPLQPATSPPFHSRGTGELEVARSPEQFEDSQQDLTDQLEVPAADLTVRGTRLEVQQKFKSKNLSYVHPIKPKMSSTMARIRNYNIKD